MRTSTSINVLFDATFRTPVEEQIQRVYDAGFRVMDMNFWDWSHSEQSPFRQNDWEKWVDRIAEKADTLGVTFSQSHAHVYNPFREPEAEYKAEIYRRCLIGSKRLGVPFVTFHPAQLPDWESRPDDAEMARKNREFFMPYVELAEKLGTGLAMENMSTRKSGFTTAEALCDFVDSFGSQAVGICWDTGHANLSGVNQTESLRLCGKRLKNLHIADNHGASDEHMPPFFGNVDWLQIMAALHEIGYEGDFTFEAHNIVRRVPAGARAEALRLLYRIGHELCSL